MAATQKDTVYIDVDDEITAIVDKIHDSTAKVVALVLPKRAAALQSIVNMKLLKRSAEDDGKTVVLITSEASLLPLAGAVGMYTAKNLQSKPEIPEAPAAIANSDEEITAELSDEPIDKTKSVDELAGGSSAATKKADTKTPKSKKDKKDKGSKKPKVPNFEKFRLKLILGVVAVVLLIGLWYLAVFVLPTARVIVSANSETVNTSFEFTARPTATSVNVEDDIVPATLAEADKEESQTASASGEKDIGERATGSLAMSVEQCNSIAQPSDVPAGTTVSASGLNFATNKKASFQFDRIENGCIYFNANSVGMTADQPGSNYNLGSTNFAVSGRSEINATGSTNGGTSKIVKVVAEQDVDSAKAKLSISDDAVKNELISELQDQQLFVISSSFDKQNENTTVSPKVGEQANEVKVTYSANFELVGVNEDDLNELIKQSISDQIDTERQGIVDNGLAQATFTVKEVQQDGSRVISLSTIVSVGPDINEAELKDELAGKKSGDAENIVSAQEGVNDVTIDLSPFWVSTIPKNPDKITFEIQDQGTE